MTELKTLKDLRSKDYPMCEGQEKMIKAEAVKWIKENNKDYGLIDLFNEDMEKKGFDISAIRQSKSYHVYLWNWIIDKFFNLTEADLQEVKG